MLSRDNTAEIAPLANTPWLYHLTHRSNLMSIRATGELRSVAMLLASSNLDSTSISDHACGPRTEWHLIATHHGPCSLPPHRRATRRHNRRSQQRSSEHVYLWTCLEQCRSYADGMVNDTPIQRRDLTALRIPTAALLNTSAGTRLMGSPSHAAADICPPISEFMPLAKQHDVPVIIAIAGALPLPAECFISRMPALNDWQQLELRQVCNS